MNSKISSTYTEQKGINTVKKQFTSNLHQRFIRVLKSKNQIIFAHLAVSVIFIVSLSEANYV